MGSPRRAATPFALVSLLLASSLPLAGCLGGTMGFDYLPERTYYRMFEQFHDARVREVKHVRETRWGLYLLGFEVRPLDAREIVDAALDGNPNHYVANLNIHGDVDAGPLLTQMLMITFPRLVVEFDVVEVTPPPLALGDAP